MSAAILSPRPAAVAAARPIVHRTRGRRHGPIVRLASPSDVGQLIKPFVFLDYFDVDAQSAPRFGWHPHSGIATLTLLLEGAFEYEDSTGARGEMGRGAVEWMQAGGGVWHTGKSRGERGQGYQLWVALPPGLENSPALSRYLGPEHFPRRGPVRVILGAWEGTASPIDVPAPMTYLDVRLQAGESWRFEPPAGHDVAWIAVHEGALQAAEPVGSGELAVFAPGSGAIELQADAGAGAGFILGSAARHAHDLVLGYYSIHTSAAALAQGEANIRRIGVELGLA